MTEETGTGKGPYTEEEIAAMPMTQEEKDAAIEVTEDLPTFVSIIGAPGAGKSELAEAIAAEYDMVVVDNYAQDLAADMDIALGFYASYVPNLMVAMEREKADHKARRSLDRNVVVVGSLIESVAYAGLQAEYHGMQISTPQQQGVLQREMLGMQVLGVMLQDLMKFHHYFYVPLPVEIEVPGKESKFDNATRSLDRAIAQIVGQLGVPVHELKGSLDAKLEAVKDTIGHLAKS